MLEICCLRVSRSMIRLVYTHWSNYLKRFPHVRKRSSCWWDLKHYTFKVHKGLAFSKCSHHVYLKKSISHSIANQNEPAVLSWHPRVVQDHYFSYLYNTIDLRTTVLLFLMPLLYSELIWLRRFPIEKMILKRRRQRKTVFFLPKPVMLWGTGPDFASCTKRVALLLLHSIHSNFRIFIK